MEVSRLAERIPDILKSNIGKYRNLLVLLIIGLLLRAILFDYVAVNADIGLYLHDAKLFSEGQTPIVDYPSRSPLFIALLSIIFELGSDPIVSARVLMIGTSLGGGLGVYYLTKSISDQHSAEIATAIYLFVPLSLFWGLWLKTETIVIVLLTVQLVWSAKYFNSPKIPFKKIIILGIVLGAGFLIRRTLIFYIIVISLYFTLYNSEEGGRSVLLRVSGAILLLASSGASIFGGYLFISRGDVNKSEHILREHLIGTLPFSIESLQLLNPISLLLISIFTIFIFSNIYQRSSPTEQMPSEKARYILSLGIYSIVAILLYSLLSTAGFNSYLFGTERQSEVIAEIAYVSLPILLSLVLFFGKIGSNRIKSPTKRAIIHVSIVLSLYWFLDTLFNQSLPLHGYKSSETLIILIISIFIISGIVLTKISSPTWKEDWTNTHTLLVLIALTIASVYLLRVRTLFISYSQELLPIVAVFMGIGLSKLGKQCTKRLSYSIVVLLVLSTVIGSLASPVIIANFGGVVRPHDSSQGTISSIQVASERIEEKTEENETIFTAQPIYPVQADRKNAENFSRQVWDYLYNGGNDSQKMTDSLIHSFQSQEIKAVVVEYRTQEVLSTSPKLEQALQNNYCIYEDEKIEKVNAELYFPVKSEYCV